MLPQFAYIRPRSLSEAFRMLLQDDAVVHGGGTDLLGCLREGVFEAKTVVSVRSIPELKGIQQIDDGGVRIGALTTITEIAEHPLVKEKYPGLAKAAVEVGSPQLRNQGTLGGNLCQKPRCWYYRGEFHCLRKGGDTCYAVDGENQFHCIFGGDSCFMVHPSDAAPALVALDAKVHIEGPKGKREVPVGEFHVLPSKDPQKETVLEQGELVTAVSVPPPAAGLRSSYRKVRARQSWDFALVGLALAVAMSAGKVTRAGVVLSGVAPVPWRLMNVEEFLPGRTLDPETIVLAADISLERAKPMELNAYKMTLLKGVMEEELTALSAR